MSPFTRKTLAPTVSGIVYKDRLADNHSTTVEVQAFTTTVVRLVIVNRRWAQHTRNPAGLHTLG